ncbi:MAG: hypothetical protein QF781_00485 [Phycisphaerales bacterium]|jgi:hypothetical protein|nr:hypothetical protein [Phycisphaerales bacterium]MDP6310617.1 hypothetical protein [Phycisphaerales bacterium]MDP7189984.1 hypothetical protein [Phycisphaerales bacterium]MDP7519861.1 hypothetical protein [Phycisphaerales bacterium]HCA38171.1 hypothetical protein [Phycisphaerales bacterium]|tara:strand:- start:353 stop:622 length:270 start_codon:yes stop_codon:yes gene_type:complete
MSENLILAWAHSLPAPVRRQLASRILAHAGSPASTLLAAFADAAGLSPGEVAGLLPGGLVQARVAANQLIRSGTADTRRPTASPPPSSF